MTAPNYEVDLVRTPREREAVYTLRIRVFVEEQAVPIEEEIDAHDVLATHFLVRRTDLPAESSHAIVATARLLEQGEGTARIGRVAVLKEYRGLGLGALLLRFIEQFAREQGYARLVLDAQCQALGFYEKLGYMAEGDIFLDCHIEHRCMHKSLD
jgi:predicted GNAT family N-acyltransferase